ncbi:arabinofuranosidase catalytic domain-containing protein [Rugosimonospora africana]|uniref:arabinofuranosidase catalytic domain-containing protein n=1 Tax=Rugosimonospora africana TaxID=556532 RepID=UPI00194448A3|nr:arabinofuranosidase catalytic domain-containing protein [Rugosimonospora africana]
MGAIGFSAFLLALVAASVVPASGLASADPAGGNSQGEPCDIYAAAGTPCVAAFSTTRALLRTYDGPLYQVQRSDNGATRDIGLLNPGGYANARLQDEFCAGTSCTVSELYDQTPRHNDLTVAGPGTAGPQNSGAVADALPITISGHKAYGLYLPPRTGYRRSSTITTGTARGSQPESMYEIASGTNISDGCCSDFGNVETDSKDTGEGHMDAVNVSYMNGGGASGTGPWVQADLENGVFQGGTSVDLGNHGNASKFVTALLKNNGTDTFALKGGDSQRGTLSKWYEGPLPSAKYTPMQLEGSIVVGTGGDDSNRGTSSFFEGVMTSGYSSDSADALVQANITAQHYQADATGPGTGTPIMTTGGECAAAAGHDDAKAGTQVELTTCESMSASAHWVASDFGDATLEALGFCMAPGNANHVVLADCDGTAGQQWRPQPDGGIRNADSGRCLTPSGDEHGILLLTPCTGDASQQLIVTVPIHHAGKCVDVAGADVGGNHALVELNGCLTLPIPGAAEHDQKWTRNPADGSLRTLGRCMTPQGSGTANGTKVELDDCVQAPAQRWQPQADGTIKNTASGRCLFDPGVSPTNGTQLELEDCDAAAGGQQFMLN